MQLIKHRLLPGLIVVLTALGSCKKNDLQNSLNPSTPTTTSADALKDSALLYSKDIYLWYNQIPSTFNARSYADLDKEMTAIRQYSTEPGFSGAVDKWRFAVKQD